MQPNDPMLAVYQDLQAKLQPNLIENYLRGIGIRAELQKMAQNAAIQRAQLELQRKGLEQERYFGEAGLGYVPGTGLTERLPLSPEKKAQLEAYKEQILTGRVTRNKIKQEIEQSKKLFPYKKEALESKIKGKDAVEIANVLKSYDAQLQYLYKLYTQPELSSKEKDMIKGEIDRITPIRDALRNRLLSIAYGKIPTPIPKEEIPSPEITPVETNESFLGKIPIIGKYLSGVGEYAKGLGKDLGTKLQEDIIPEVSSFSKEKTADMVKNVAIHVRDTLEANPPLSSNPGIRQRQQELWDTLESKRLAYRKKATQIIEDFVKRYEKEGAFIKSPVLDLLKIEKDWENDKRKLMEKYPILRTK
ncbi:MAG: hypothetical protein J7K15_12220 [Deltaproteobacteria bacterium]|nr:hypothetical protein [Deltaproteobacteria bacterium]